MAAGCTDLRSLQLALGLGSCCGTCLDYVQEMLDAQPQRVCKVSAAVALGT
jgi:bacterioferritin-associated ferredoxin